MITEETLIGLLGHPINSKEIEDFFGKYKIKSPKKKDAFHISPHMDTGYIYVDAKEQCGLFFVFQVVLWHFSHETVYPSKESGNHYPVLSTIMHYDHPDVKKEMPNKDLRYGMTEAEVRKVLGEPHANMYKPPISDRFEAPIEWKLYTSDGYTVRNIHVFEGGTLDRIVITKNIYKPLFYVKSPFHYREGDKYIFIKWAIKNDYFHLYPFPDEYKELLVNEDVKFEELLEDTMRMSRVFVAYFKSEIHPFILNYFTDDFSGKIPGYEEDYRACGCKTISFYHTEEQIKEILENYEKFYALISKRLEEFNEKYA